LCGEQIAHRANFAHIGKPKQNALCLGIGRGNKSAMNRRHARPRHHHHHPRHTSSSLGPALKRWRLLHRVKQSHAAELFNVNQSTISRWESGTQAMEPAERARAEALLSARLDAAADHALARLVDESPRPVHLVCDITHRLLACSARRAAEFGAPLSAAAGPLALALCHAGDRGQGGDARQHRLARCARAALAGVRHGHQRIGI
jgi:transcriptional regulator with XRE-family HTH domain